MSNTDDKRNDPTLVRNQNALQGARRRQWLVPGGILAAVVMALLVFAFDIQITIPAVAIGATVVLYAAMVVVASAVPSVPRRNKILAALMAGIAVVGLGSLLALVLVQRV